MNYSITTLPQIFLNSHHEKIEDHIGWIEPCGLVYLKTMKHGGVDISNIKASNDVVSYVRTIQSTQSGTGKSYVPYRNFNTNTNINTIAYEITAQIVGKLDLAPENMEDFKNYINYAVSEVMQNVLDHSGSACGGHVVGQSYPQKGKVQFAVSDCGVGLMATLQNEYGVRSEREAILKALEPQVSGSVVIGPYGEKRNAGIGLFALKCIIDETKGQLLIISNDTIYTRHNGKESFEHVPESRFCGTLVAFELSEHNTDYYFEEFKKMHIWSAVNKTDEEEFF
ncbi:ATP-binding protein [Hydrogenimonas sp.]